MSVSRILFGTCIAKFSFGDVSDTLGVCSAEFVLRRTVDARFARGISGPAICRDFQGQFYIAIV